MTDDGYAWARRRYRESIPQDKARAEGERIRREYEAGKLRERAALLRQEFSDRMSMPERADELEREAEALMAV